MRELSIILITNSQLYIIVLIIIIFSNLTYIRED